MHITHRSGVDTVQNIALMEYLNISLPNNRVLTLGYNYADSTYVFEQDIEFNGWIISKIIKIGGPPSCYKYNFDNYFEFVITDSKNFQRIEKYFYNCKDIKLLRERQNSIDDISDFIQSSLIFQCKDWADYDRKICKTLADIKGVINTDISQREQLERIKQILNNL